MLDIARYATNLIVAFEICILDLHLRFAFEICIWDLFLRFVFEICILDFNCLDRQDKEDHTCEPTQTYYKDSSTIFSFSKHKKEIIGHVILVSRNMVLTQFSSYVTIITCVYNISKGLRLPSHRRRSWHIVVHESLLPLSFCQFLSLVWKTLQ